MCPQCYVNASWGDIMQRRLLLFRSLTSQARPWGRCGARPLEHAATVPACGRPFIYSTSHRPAPGQRSLAARRLTPFATELERGRMPLCPCFREPSRFRGLFEVDVPGRGPGPPRRPVRPGVAPYPEHPAAFAFPLPPSSRPSNLRKRGRHLQMLDGRE